MTAKQARKDRVIAALPGNVHDVIERTKLGYVTVYRWLKQMHKAKETHIVSWSRKEDSTWWLPTYAYGPGRNARKPRVMTDQERYRKYRQKDEVKARDRARYWADRAKTRPNTWLSGLGVK